MPMPIPPLRPHPDEIRRRIANGARTMKEIDPAFHAWSMKCERIRRVQIFCLLIGSIGGLIFIAVCTILNH